MNHINAGAEQAREAARRGNGKFGEQQFADPGQLTISDRTEPDFVTLRDRIDELSETMDCAFRIGPDGSAERDGVYVPQVWFDEESGSAIVESGDWYLDEFREPAELLSPRDAETMWQESADSGQSTVYAIVPVETEEPDDFGERDAVGWAILRRRATGEA